MPPQTSHTHPIVGPRLPGIRGSVRELRGVDGRLALGKVVVLSRQHPVLDLAGEAAHVDHGGGEGQGAALRHTDTHTRQRPASPHMAPRWWWWSARRRRPLHLSFARRGQGKRHVTAHAHRRSFREFSVYVLSISLFSRSHRPLQSPYIYILVYSSVACLARPVSGQAVRPSLKVFSDRISCYSKSLASCIVFLYPRVSLGVSSRLSHRHSSYGILRMDYYFLLFFL